MACPKNIDWLCDVFISAAFGTLNGYVLLHIVFGVDSTIAFLAGFIAGAVTGGLLLGDK